MIEPRKQRGIWRRTSVLAAAALAAGWLLPTAAAAVPPALAAPAVADVQALDVTPTLSMSFDPATIGVGRSAELTFTVTNTAELGAKNGWGFTDTLPAGLTVAGFPVIVCAATVTASPGSTVIEVAGSLLDGQDSCEISVPVVAGDTGTYVSTPSDVTALVDILAPTSDASLVVTSAPAMTITKSSTTSVITTPGQVVPYEFVVSNTGNVDLNSVAAKDDIEAPDGSVSAGVVSCPGVTLAVGASMTCTSSYTVTKADLDHGFIRDTGEAIGRGPATPSQPDPPFITPVLSQALTIPSDSVPELSLVATANPQVVTRIGEAVTFSFLVTNSGDVSLEEVGVSLLDFTGTGSEPSLDCPRATLAPGASRTCTATYTVAPSDVDDDGFILVSSASGSTAARALVSTPPVATNVVVRVPSLVIAKSSTTTTITSVRQTVHFDFHVENTGNVQLTGIDVTDAILPPADPTGLTAVDCPATVLDPDGAMDCEAVYTVTQADLDHGFIRDTATATGTPPSGGDVTATSTLTIMSDGLPGITVRKSVDPTSVASAGETVTYSFLITNTGELTLDSIAVAEDTFTGSGSLSAIDCPTTTLEPGGSTTCTAVYTVTEADIAAGGVSNSASVSAMTAALTTVASAGESTATLTVPSTPMLPPTGGIVNVGLWLGIAGVLLAGGAILVTVMLIRRRRS